MKTKKNVARVARAKSTSYEVDIAQEFKDVKETFSDGLSKLDAKLDGFKEEISTWRTIFESKLTELNANMKGVLERLTSHDYRFTEHDSRIKRLEMSDAKSNGHAEGLDEGRKFLWAAAKAGLVVGALIGAVGGCGWILKLLAVI